MPSKKNAVAAREPAGFLALTAPNLAERIAEELDGFDLSFEKVKIPSGGITAFEIPGEDGEPAIVKEFCGVILHQHALNTWYATKYTGGNQPPDCAAIDGKHGVKRATGEVCDCADCPRNEFDSGDNGGKACQNRRRIYILREGEVFPLLLSLPTGSLRAFQKYMKLILSRQKFPDQVLTRFSLEKAQNTGGVEFSRARFARDRDLSPEECAAVAPLAAQVRAYSKTVGFDEDVPAEDAPPPEAPPPDDGDVPPFA